jgi:hypothetical protein
MTIVMVEGAYRFNMYTVGETAEETGCACMMHQSETAASILGPFTEQHDSSDAPGRDWNAISMVVEARCPCMGLL